MSAPFDGLRPPPPDPGLKARVLAAAFAARADAPHWIDVLWESRRFRLALTAAFALAIVASLPPRDRPAPRLAPPRLVDVEGFSVRADLFEADAPLPLEAAR